MESAKNILDKLASTLKQGAVPSGVPSNPGTGLSQGGGAKILKNVANPAKTVAAKNAPATPKTATASVREKMALVIKLARLGLRLGGAMRTFVPKQTAAPKVGPAAAKIGPTTAIANQVQKLKLAPTGTPVGKPAGTVAPPPAAAKPVAQAKTVPVSQAPSNTTVKMPKPRPTAGQVAAKQQAQPTGQPTQQAQPTGQPTQQAQPTGQPTQSASGGGDVMSAANDMLKQFGRIQKQMMAGQALNTTTQGVVEALRSPYG
jgi:predicted component of type VI protein secretion system